MKTIASATGKLGTTIVIVGVGLIGGSIARAVRSRGLFERIIGVGRNPQRLQQAVEQGVIDEYACHGSEAAAQADLIVVCTPVEQIAEDVLELHACLPAGGVITDAGSTKGGICRRVRDGLETGHRFVGAHPLAGSEKSGFEYAQADLFEEAVVILTPDDSTAPFAAERVAEFWSSLGGRLVTMGAAEHDLILAMTSHLPHLVSSALAASVTERGLPLAATGFGDTTRIAAGDPRLWTSIFMENADATIHAAEEFLLRFQALLSALKDRQPERLHSLLSTGKQHRDLWQQTNTR